MEFQKRFHAGMPLEQVIQAAADFQRELETQFNQMINHSHAPILVPRTTIDVTHAIRNIAGASMAAAWNSVGIASTATTTSSSFATAVSYTGRGVLTKAVVAEVTSGGTTAGRNGGMRITIDDNVVYTATNSITRQSSWRVIVGNEIEISATLVGITQSPIGLPFNSSCLIEIVGNASGDTITAGWHIVKKL